MGIISPGFSGGCGSKNEPAGASAREILDRAEELARGELYQEALRALESQLGNFSGAERHALQVQTIRILLQSNSSLQAMAAVEKQLAERPDDPQALLLRGEAERRLARFPEAEESLRKGLAALKGQLDGTLDGKLALARTLYRLGKADESARLFKDFLERAAKGAMTFEGDPEAIRLEYGRALVLGSRLAEAADVFAALLEARPMESLIYSELARTQFRLGRREAGKFLQEIYNHISPRDYQKQVEDRLLESGQTVFGLGQRAFNYLNDKRFADAFETYERAIRLEKTDARAHAFFADLALRFHRHGQALLIIEDAFKKNMQPRSGLFLRQGMALEEKEDRAGAEAAYRKAREELQKEGDRGGPEKGQAALINLLLRRIANAFAAKRPGDALPWIEEAARDQPGAWEPSYWRGRAALELGKPQEALSALEEAASRGGGQAPVVALARARAVAQAGDPAQGARLLLELIQKMPALLEAYDALLEIGRSGVSLPEPLAPAREQLAGLLARARELKARIDREPLDRSCGDDLIELGKLFLQLRNSAEALDALLFGVELSPANPDGYQQLLARLARNEDVFLRLRFLRKLAELQPGEAQAHKALAAIYLKLRVRLDEAMKAAERLNQLQPGEESRKLLDEVRGAMQQPGGG